MASPLPHFRVGDTPSMMEAVVAEEVRDSIEALRGMKIVPQGIGKLIVGDKDATLDLTPLVALLKKLNQSEITNALTTATGTGGTGTLEFPFQIQRVNDTTINVRYGELMDLPPDGVGEDADVTAVTSDGTVYIFIDCTLDAAGNIVDAELNSNDTGRPGNTSDHAYKSVGNVVVVGGVITTINQGLMFSQGFKACGRDADDPSTTPGDYQFFVD